MPGDLQAEFVGTRARGRTRCRLAICAFQPNRPTRPSASPADPAPDFGRLACGHGGQHLGRNRVDPTRAEEGRGIPLRDGEVDAIHRLEAGRSVAQPPTRCGLLLRPSDPRLDRILASVWRVARGRES